MWPAWRCCSRATRWGRPARRSTGSAAPGWTRWAPPRACCVPADAELVLAGGVESMTRAPFVMGKATEAFSRQAELQDTTLGWRFVNPAMRAAWGVDTMPETGDNVAEQYKVSREDQDRFAYRSQQRAKAAQESGFFAREISPVTIRSRKSEVVVSVDEHPRPDTTLEGLAKLRAPFRPEGGTVTAGNASGLTTVPPR